MLTFEKRELQQNAQHVDSDQLIAGTDYYMVSYAADDFSIPVMESLIFLGVNIVGEEEKDMSYLYFQDAESYRDGVRMNEKPESGTYNLYRFTPDQLDMIYEFERALDELLKCSIQRNKNKR
ncbi:hypothetical protein ISN75_04425 [Dyella marensis]|uniref:hypothetical protein n=1 Tax=Dyella marensis TaxID=500610 RepID=UPI0031D449C1